MTRGPFIVATWARRDEPNELVEGLRRNVGWADGLVEVEADRTAPGWGHEGRLRARQRAAVRQAYGWGVWVLFMDPDERLEESAEAEIRRGLPMLATRGGPGYAVGFQLREMWTPTAYRIDSGWADKQPRWRLFQLNPGQNFRDKPIHCGVTPIGAHRLALDSRLYHLKMIEPANRQARRQAYLSADPTGKHQRQAGDWGHLVDENNLQVEELPPGRGFVPPYRPGSYLFVPPGRPADS